MRGAGSKPSLSINSLNKNKLLCISTLEVLKSGQGGRKTFLEHRPREAQLCYICNKPGHVAKYCRAPKTESGYKSESKGSTTKAESKDSGSKSYQQPRPHGVGARKIESNSNQDKSEAVIQEGSANLLSLLYSSDSDSDVKAIRVHDEGSKPCCARVLVQGVPAYGIIGTAADITIIGGNLSSQCSTPEEEESETCR